MEFIKEFTDYLAETGVSKVSIKNYNSDLRYFMKWFNKSYDENFYPEKLNSSVIHNFKLSTSNKSILSTKRRLSTIRKLSRFALSKNYIKDNPFIEGETLSAQHVDLGELRNFLHKKGLSPASIKNYLADITQFTDWVGKVNVSGSDWSASTNIFESLNPALIDEYKDRLLRMHFSPTSINRKLSSIRTLVSWASDTDRIPNDFMNNKAYFPFTARNSFINLGKEEVKPELLTNQPLKYSSIGPLRLFQKIGYGAEYIFDLILTDSIIKAWNAIESIFSENKQSIFISDKNRVPILEDPIKVVNISKSFYDPLNISVKHFPWYKRLLHIIRFNRPKWYLKYHSFPIAHYAHFGLLIVIASIFGFIAYQRIWSTPDLRGVLGTAFSPSSRAITVREKLSDASGNPITSPSSVRFAIYDDKIASGSSLIWQEVETVNPNEDGEFSVTLGQNSQIPSELFLSHPSIWLGMTVEQTDELKPRRRLSQVGSSDDAATIQNMGIAGLTNYTNAILALDSTGNITLGGSSHTIQSIDGELVLSGNKLFLTSVAGTNADIQLSPDGFGKIDITKPIQNTSDYNNIPSAIGSVELDDIVSILATSSGQSAFTINQNDIGPLISASSSGIAKFTVDGFGNTTLAGNLNLSGNNTNIFATNRGSVLAIGSSGNGRLLLQPVANGNIEFFSALNNISSSGNLRLTGDIILATASATTFGGIKYTWPTSGQSNGFFLKTNGSGALSWSAIPDLTGIWDQSGRKNVGIGTTDPKFRLDIQEGQSATAAAQIFNTDTGTTSTGVVLKLGNSSATTNVNNKWISFEQAGAGIVGLVKGNGSDGITFQTSGIADFAEYLKKDINESIDYEMVVCMGPNGLVSLCNSVNDNIVGVTSKNPAFLGGQNLGNGSIAVGLTGQVKVKVSNLNGDIKAGDALVPSYIPGVAVKAIREGRMVGHAVSDFNSSNCSFNPSGNFGLVDSTDRICQGSIYIVLNISHFEPSLAQKSEQIAGMVLRQTEDGAFEAKNALGDTIEKSDAFATAIIGNLTAGLVNAEKVVARAIEANSIKINGQELKDYIANIMRQNQVSPPSGETQISVISPLAQSKKVIVRLPEESSFTIENSSQSAVASIDDEGNASFSGQLAARTIQTQEINSENLISETASVAGVLRAGKIIAETIEGLPQTNYADLATLSSQFAYVGNLRAITGNFSDGLVVQSPSSFSDISIFGQLKIDNTLILAANSINTLGASLELQPLKQGALSIMGGLIYIDTDGNAKFGNDTEFAKNVTVRGTLSANLISPLSDQDLAIDTGDGRFLIRNSSQSGTLLSIDRNGDLSASGSGTFNKINLSLVQPAYAISSTEIIATGSAGIATISARQKELTINNKLVTSRSLIYVTPRVDTNNIVIYLLRQVPGVSFTVGINSPLNKAVPFNWIIVN